MDEFILTLQMKESCQALKGLLESQRELLGDSKSRSQTPGVSRVPARRPQCAYPAHGPLGKGRILDSWQKTNLEGSF